MSGEMPAFDQLADDADELGWDREAHGRMVDYATDDEPLTMRYDPAADPFLREG